MRGILQIVQNTPLWAFALFALLLVLGIQALRTRTIPVWRILVVPAVFIGWGAISVAIRIASPVLIADWLVAAAIGAMVGWASTRFNAMHFNEERNLIELPGSALPLVRNLVIFGSKYALAVAAALLPLQQPSILFWDIAVSGLSAGYFLGWLARFALAYRRSSGEMRPIAAQEPQA